MKKLFFILFLVIPAFCFAESLKTNSDANVRNSPSKEGAVITVLTKGTQIEGEKASTNNDWYEITVVLPKVNLDFFIKANKVV